MFTGHTHTHGVSLLIVVCGYQFTPSLRFIQALRAISSKIGVSLLVLGALLMLGITPDAVCGIDCGGLLASRC